MGVTAVAAVVGAASTSATVMGAIGLTALSAETVAMVGIGLSVVGAVTGNSTLSKLGGGLGLGGAIEGFVGGSLTSGSGAPVQVDTGAGQVGAATPAAQATVSADQAAAVENSGTGAQVNSDATVTQQGSATDATGNASNTNLQSGGSGANTATTNPYTDQAGMPGSSQAGPPAAGAGSSMPGYDATTQQALTTQLRNAASGGASSILQWVNSNPKAAGMIMQGAGSALSGLMQGWSASQKLALEQAQFQLQQTQYNTAMANANSPGGIAYANTAPLQATGTQATGTQPTGTQAPAATVGNQPASGAPAGTSAQPTNGLIQLAQTQGPTTNPAAAAQA